MRVRGVTYDTGFLGEGTSTHPNFDAAKVYREMEIIRRDLHCTAVRVTGGEPDRLETAAKAAVAAGLEVWFSPFTNELNQEELLSLQTVPNGPNASGLWGRRWSWSRVQN